MTYRRRLSQITARHVPILIQAEVCTWTTIEDRITSLLAVVLVITAKKPSCLFQLNVSDLLALEL